MKTLALVALGALALVATGAAYARQSRPATLEQDIGPRVPDATDTQDVGQWLQDVENELMPPAPIEGATEANRRAFLQMIMACEGTLNAGGYAALYGSTPSRPRTFASFADHPRIVSRVSASDARWTSAAGAHQMMAVSPIPGGGYTRVNTWDRLKAKLNLPDFSPASQDAAALELIAEQGALADVDAGRVLEAARKCRTQWASLPGANYAGQGMRSPDFLVAQYVAAGGVLA